jgi:acetyl esterase/lipase
MCVYVVTLVCTFKGGGFQGGSAAQTHPMNLVRNEQVIVVVIQYRLGAMGFLAVNQMLDEDENLNFGLQDQQASFLWVRNNIAAFSGMKARFAAISMRLCLGQWTSEASSLTNRPTGR